MTELKLKVDNVERERDFYFDKLRDIEILCQMPLLQSIPVRAFLWCTDILCIAVHQQDSVILNILWVSIPSVSDMILSVAVLMQVSAGV